MHRLAFRLLQPLSILAADRSKVLWNFNKFKYTLIPIAGTSIYYLLHQNHFVHIELDEVDPDCLY